MILRLRHVAWAAVVFGAAARVVAQSSTPDLTTIAIEDLMNLKITTATRTAEGALQAPAHVQVVTAAQIERRGYRSLADVLKDISEIKVDLAGDQDYPTELTVQGARGASRIVVLLDGIRVSSPTNEPLPILANYPVHSAKQVEILFGPASALYGADAFSAVVNIISRSGSESPGLTASSSAGQFGLSNQTVSYGTRVGRRGDLFVGGQVFYDRQPDLTRYYPEDFGGLQGQRTGVFNTIFGPMTPSQSAPASYQNSLSAHSVQATLHLGAFTFSLFENQSRTPTAPAYTPDNAVYSDSAFNKNHLLVASGSYTHRFGAVTSVSTVTGSRHELDPQSGYWNVYSNFERSYKYAYGSMLKAEQQLSWSLGRSRFTTGGTVEHFFSIPQGADLNAPVTSRDAPGTILDTNIVDDFYKVRYLNSGVYGQLQYALTPRIEATVGGRADYNTRFGETFNPRAGLVAHPSSKTTVKLLFGTAYLAPSPYQEYTHYGSFYSLDGGQTYQSDYWHLPNPDLKPQREETYEVELLQTMSPFLVSVSAFHTRVHDAIVEADPDRAYSGFFHGWPVAYIDFAVNEGSQQIYGGTVAVTGAKTFGLDGRVESHVAVTLADGHVWNDDTSPNGELSVGGMSPLQARAGLDVDWHRWSVAARVTAMDRQRLTATVVSADGSLERQAIPGYATADLTIRRRNVVRHLDAFLMIENAFDARYRTINPRAITNPEELVGAPQNPRRISAGATVRLP